MARRVAAGAGEPALAGCDGYSNAGRTCDRAAAESRAAAAARFTAAAARFTAAAARCTAATTAAATNPTTASQSGRKRIAAGLWRTNCSAGRNEAPGNSRRVGKQTGPHAAARRVARFARPGTEQAFKSCAAARTADNTAGHTAGHPSRHASGGEEARWFGEVAKELDAGGWSETGTHVRRHRG